MRKSYLNYPGLNSSEELNAWGEHRDLGQEGKAFLELRFQPSSSGKWADPLCRVSKQDSVCGGAASIPANPAMGRSCAIRESFLNYIWRNCGHHCPCHKPSKKLQLKKEKEKCKCLCTGSFFLEECNQCFLLVGFSLQWSWWPEVAPAPCSHRSSEQDLQEEWGGKRSLLSLQNIQHQHCHHLLTYPRACSASLEFINVPFWVMWSAPWGRDCASLNTCRVPSSLGLPWCWSLLPEKETCRSRSGKKINGICLNFSWKRRHPFPSYSEIICLLVNEF